MANTVLKYNLCRTIVSNKSTLCGEPNFGKPLITLRRLVLSSSAKEKV